ncbi:MAG: hypothetical protein R3304_06470 [Longimicrobiales bacterium]|nr:hypothetical protein [Longimicrobiales bacterium]
MRTDAAVDPRLVRSIPCLVLAILVVGCTEGIVEPSEPNADLSGSWSLTKSLRHSGSGVSNGAVLKAFLRFDQDRGGRISGTQTDSELSQVACSSYFGCLTSVEAWGEVRISGSVQGRDVSLELVVDEEGNRRTFIGVVEGDRIQGDGWSAERSVRPSDEATSTGPPGAPTGLSATIDSPRREVTLRWTDNSDDEDGFAVVGSCNGHEAEVWGTSPPDHTSGTASGFSSGDTCQIVVVAFRRVDDEVIASAPSNRITVRIP